MFQLILIRVMGGLCLHETNSKSLESKYHEVSN